MDTNLMNFIDAMKLVKDGKAVHRRCWGDGCQLSQSAKGEHLFIAYHVAACEIPVTIDDVLANDWQEKKYDH